MIDNILGTDLTIEWPITIDGEEQELENTDINVYVKCNLFRKKMNIETEGNTITFTFLGKEQRVRGVYDLELIMNEGKVGQVVLYEKKVFRLYN